MSDRKIMSVEMSEEAYDIVHMMREIDPSITMKEFITRAILSYGERIKPLVELQRKQKEERERLAKEIGV